MLAPSYTMFNKGDVVNGYATTVRWCSVRDTGLGFAPRKLFCTTAGDKMLLWAAQQRQAWHVVKMM